MDRHPPDEQVESAPLDGVEATQELTRTGLKRVVDIARAAPLGSTFLLISSGLVAAQFYHDQLFMAVSNLLLGVGSSAVLTAKQVILLRRLEELARKKGYSDRLFKPTTQQWCDRQTAGVVARNVGKKEEFDALCASTRASSSLPWLPNF